MKRRKFLKSFAAAVAVVTVAPVAIANATVRKDRFPFVGWFIPGNPPQMINLPDINSELFIRYKPVTDAAYDGEKCNLWIVDEDGKMSHDRGVFVWSNNK